MTHRYGMTFLAFALSIGTARAQFYNYLYRGEAMCAVGASTSPVGTKPTVGCGAGMNPLVFIYTEVGVMAPQANRSYLSAYLTNDLQLPLWVPKKHPDWVPVGAVGYTRMFETGHAVDFALGLAVATRKDKDKSLLIELRDYWTFANPAQHNVVLRLGWIVGVPD